MARRPTHRKPSVSAMTENSEQQVTPEMIEAGAQALADDVWHPPLKLESLSRHEANKFRRQAQIVLTAALSRS